MLKTKEATSGLTYIFEIRYLVSKLIVYIKKTGAQDESEPGNRQHSFPSLWKWIPEAWAKQCRMIEELFIRQFHMKFQYHRELRVKLLLIQCAYKKDLALYLIDPPSSPRGRRDGRVIFLFNSIHQPTYFPYMFQEPLFLQSHFLPLNLFCFALSMGSRCWRVHCAKDRSLRGACPGIVTRGAWATQGSVRDVSPPCWEQQNSPRIIFLFHSALQCLSGSNDDKHVVCGK